MNQITKDRVKIIRSLENFKEIVGSEQYEQSEHLEKLVKAIRKDTDRFLSLSQEQIGKISYAGAPEHKLDTKRRIRTSFYRYVRNQLQLGESDISNVFLSKIAARISGHTSIGKFIRIIEGQDLYDAYQDDTFPESCMFGKSYVRFYANNPDKVKMVIANIPTEAGRTNTRALIWYTDQGTIVFDRVYPTDNSWHTEALKNWARERGYIIGYAKEECTKGLTVTMNSSNGEYPYLDTFMYASGQLGSKNFVLFTQSSTGQKGYDYVLQSTEGYAIDEDEGYEDTVTCSNCDFRSHEDEFIWVCDDPICPRCIRRYYIACERCHDYEQKDDSLRVGDGWYCRYCAKEVCTNCEQCDEAILTKDAVSFNDEMFCDKCHDELFVECPSCHQMKEININVCPNCPTQETGDVVEPIATGDTAMDLFFINFPLIPQRLSLKNTNTTGETNGL